MPRSRPQSPAGPRPRSCRAACPPPRSIYLHIHLHIYIYICINIHTSIMPGSLPTAALVRSTALSMLANASADRSGSGMHAGFSTMASCSLGGSPVCFVSTAGHSFCITSVDARVHMRARARPRLSVRASEQAGKRAWRSSTRFLAKKEG